MPQIPTNTERVSLLGRGSNLSEASGSAFGAEIGQSIQQLAHAGSQAADTLGQVSRTKRALDADKYSNEAMAQLRDYYSTRMSDVEFNSTETYAEDLQKEMQKSLTDWEAKAPNKEARVIFRENFQRFANSRFESASVTTSKTQMSNMLRSHEEQNGSIIRAYETNRLTPDLDANAELEADIQSRFAQLDRGLNQVAPEQARALKAQLVEDGAYAAMNYSPATARRILKQGTGLMDGRRIHAIESQIKTAEDALATIDVIALNRIGGDAITMAHTFGNQAELTLADLKGLVPDKKANVLLNDWNAQIRMGNGINEHSKKVKSWNANAQLAYVDQLEKKIGTSSEGAKFDEAVFADVKRRVHQNVMDFAKDPSGYLIKNNPAAAGLDKQIADLRARDTTLKAEKPNPEIKQKSAELSALLLQLQSAPTEESDKNLHTVVPRAQLMVMSKQQAETSATWVNDSSPQDAVANVQAVLANHPGNEAIAFANLVQNGLDLSYWGLYQNRNNPRAAELVGALQWAKESKELNADIAKEVTDALNPGANPKWDAWKRIFPDDHGQREGITAGMQRAIIAHATMMTQRDKKKSPKLAVADAVDTWLYSEMALTSVNGQPLLIERSVNGRPKMNDAEATDFGRRLGELPKVIDPRSLDNKEHYFPGIWGPNGPGNEMTKWEQMRSAIVTRGFFKPAGEYSTLYLTSDTGQAFEARSGGKAIAIKNEEVPTFMEEIAGQTIYGEIPKEIPGTSVPKSLEVKPLVTTERKVTYREWAPGHGTGRITTDIISTNWPVEPKYLQRITR